MVETRTVFGTRAEPYFDDLARLRIEVFRGFPYLYDGDAGYERRYLSTYAKARDSVFIFAIDKDRVVGASTGMPLDQETGEVQAPWREAGFDPGQVFYFGESVLLPDYRGLGLGHRFFDEREAHARRLGRFTRTSFCAVEREPDHPARPPGYRPLHDFWHRRGYVRHADLFCTMRWTDLGDDRERAHRLHFWSRAISRQDAS